MSKSEKKCDLAICADEKIIHVHKDVLCAASDYFTAMFAHDTKEKQSGFIDMKNIELFALAKCIDFIYFGNFVYLEDETLEILNAANLMTLDELLEKISKNLARRLTPKTYFDINLIADMFALKTLKEFCNEFAVENLYLLAQAEEFKCLHMEYVYFLLSSKKSSTIKTENSKLSMALQWIKSDPENREKHFLVLTEAIDFSKLTPEYAMFLVRNEPLCSNHPEVLKRICSGMADSYEEDETILPSFRVVSPKSLRIKNKLIRNLWLYHPSIDEVSKAVEFYNDVTFHFNACLFGEYLYVFQSNRMAFYTNIRDAKTWNRIPDMLLDHGQLMQSVVLGDYIYVGGNNNMERFRVLSGGNWEAIKLQGNICDRSALVSYEECVFVIGGQECDVTVKKVTKFSPLSSEWEQMKSMNTACCSASAVVYHGNIYVLGRTRDSATRQFQMYEGLPDMWTTLSQENLTHIEVTLHVIQDEVMAIGKENSERVMQFYYGKEGTWLRIRDDEASNIIKKSAVKLSFLLD